MPKIVLAGQEKVTLLYGSQTIDLSDGGFETVDKAMITAAMENPHLKVEDTEADKAPPAQLERDETDPQVNPTVDHLSKDATDETRAAADRKNKELQAAHYPNVEASDTVKPAIDTRKPKINEQAKVEETNKS